MLKEKKIVLFVLMVMAFFKLYGQDSIPNTMVNKYFSYFLNEGYRVQLHLNKEVYTPNELAFFTSYIFFENGRIRNQDYNLNVGIYDLEGKLLETEVFQVVNGVAVGSLSMNKPFGVYYVKAQLDGVTIKSRPFVTQIKITSEVFHDSVKPEMASYVLDVNCEGGSCMGKVKNELFFSVSGVKNKEVSIVSAIIKNDKGDAVASLNYTNDGIGYGDFTPENDVKYNLEVTLSNELTILKNITIVTSSKVKVSANVMLEKDLLISFETSEHLLEEEQTYYVVFHNGSKIKLHTIILDKKNKLFRIPFEKLLPDVNILTVLNAEKELFFERLFFNPKHSVKKDFSVEASILNTVSGDSIDVQVSINKALNDKFKHVSASVVSDESLIWRDVSMSKSLVFAPYIKMSNLKNMPDLPLKNRKQRKVLDAYLMLYGKSDYDIQEVFNTLHVEQLEITSGFTISGSIKLPAKWRDATLLFYQKSINELYSTVISEDGSFEFKNCFLDKNEKIIFSATVDGKPMGTPEIMLEIFPKQIQDSLPKSILAYFEEKPRQGAETSYVKDVENLRAKDVVSLDAIIVKGNNKKSKLVRNPDLIGGVWNAKKINEDDLKRSATLSQFIRRLSFRVATDAVSGQLKILARNPLDGSPTVFVDGFQSGSSISDVPLDYIDEVYYEQNNANGNLGGTIYIYRKQGSTLGEEDSIVQKSPINGYTLPQDYENFTLFKNFDKKQRLYTELHWEYDVAFDGSGKAILRFPHFGVKHFKIQLNGIDHEGNVVSESMFFSMD